MHLTHLPPTPEQQWSLAIHAGAGPRPRPLTPEETAGYEAGLRLAVDAGRAVLQDGGAALDAVTAAVLVLEDDEHFNAGRGAALTSAGTVELDAAVMSGTDRSAGAVTGSTRARNPVLAARAVREQTRHVLVADPDSDLLARWGVPTAPQDYFVTPRRRAQLDDALGADASTPRWPAPESPVPGTVVGHGTVGAVARDSRGNLAAATSTGGVTHQMVGRIGDAPIVGAGTYADDRTVAVSCTGIGEYFLRGVLAHDVAARIRYRGDTLHDAVESAIDEHLVATGGDGGLIAVDSAGGVVLGFCSAAMFRGYATSTGETEVVA